MYRAVNLLYPRSHLVHLQTAFIEREKTTGFAACSGLRQANLLRSFALHTFSVYLVLNNLSSDNATPIPPHKKRRRKAYFPVLHFIIQIPPVASQKNTSSRRRQLSITHYKLVIKS